MTASSVFNAYLDANLILVLAACLWCAVRFILRRTLLRHAYLMQLHMVYGILLAVVCTPLVILLHSVSLQTGLIGAGASPSISDYVLSQFLSGRIEMAPSQFEALWMSRTVVTQEITSLGSPVGIAVATVIGAGICFFLANLIRSALHVRKLLRSGFLWRRHGALDVLLTDKCDVPFSTRGLRRRYILLPSALLSESDDLRIAVAHELQHIRQGDLGWEIVLEILRPLVFWNPAFLFFKREVEALRELACDQQVILRRGISVDQYCNCLLRVCRNAMDRCNVRQILVPGVPLIRPEEGHRAARFLRRRVVSMLTAKWQVPGKWMTGILVLPLVAAITFGAVAAQSSGDWSQDRLMLSAIVNLERLDQRTLASRY